MQVNISKGVTKIRLTKREQATLNCAADICEQLSRQFVGCESVEAKYDTTSDALRDAAKNYGTEDKPAEKATVKK